MARTVMMGYATTVAMAACPSLNIHFLSGYTVVPRRERLNNDRENNVKFLRSAGEKPPGEGGGWIISQGFEEPLMLSNLAHTYYFRIKSYLLLFKLAVDSAACELAP